MEKHLPYTTSNITSTALLNLNAINCCYDLNKAFCRLLANDKSLDTFSKIAAGTQLVNPYISFNSYDTNSRITGNMFEPYSTDVSKKFKIIASLKYIGADTPPTEINTALYNEYDKAFSNTAKYDWIIDTYSPDYSTVPKNYLKAVNLEDQSIYELSSSIKGDIVSYDTPETSTDLDYVIKTGVVKTPYVIYANTTDWIVGGKLPTDQMVKTECYSWYRLYKSGYIECGGISRPFSLTEQWNGNFGKSLIKIKFPKSLNCLNANYSFIGLDNNFITQYDKIYTNETLAMYQITESRQTAKNYIYDSVKSSPDANVGNYIQSITTDELTIQINNESYDLNNSALGKTDALAIQISWQASGIAV